VHLKLEDELNFLLSVSLSYQMKNPNFNIQISNKLQNTNTNELFLQIELSIGY